MNAAGRPVPAGYPGVFAKFPTSLIPDGEDIVLPDDATNVHFEGELVLVLGKKAKNVPVADASDYVFGVTIGNDLVDRGWLLEDLQWFRAKGSDTFLPMGPVFVTKDEVDPATGLRLRSWRIPAGSDERSRAAVPGPAARTGPSSPRINPHLFHRLTQSG